MAQRTRTRQGPGGRFGTGAGGPYPGSAGAARRRADPRLVERVLAEQDAYRRAAPSIVPRAARMLARPFGLLSSRLIPAGAIEAALRGADWAASSTIRRSAVSHDVADLAACEEAAEEIRRWALGYAVTGGGAAGAFGLAGLAVDVPSTITLALRTARLTGMCYGFGGEGEAERIFVLDLLGMAGANTREEKAQALARLDRDQDRVAPQTWSRIVALTGQTSGSMAATRRVATVLGVNLSTRKVAQLAPVIGAAVGASVNAAFQNDVARAARHGYRARWLARHEGLLEGIGVSLPDQTA